MPTVQEQVDRMRDAFDNYDTEAFAALYHPDAVVTDPMYPEPLQGVDAIKKDMEEFATAFPDLEGRFDRVIVDSDTCAMELTMQGTHTGLLHARSGDIPPTNKPIELHMSAFARFDDQGRIVEERRYYDTAAMFEQLGSPS